MLKLNIKRILDFDKPGSKAYLLAIVLIILVVSVVFRNYFFNCVYCFKDVGCDSYNEFYAFQYLTSDYIAKYGIPKWSFNLGMGQNIFQFFLHDPFDIFLYIAGKNHILYFLLYKEIAKILFGGLIFFFYLKTLKLSDYTSIIGSLLFAFSSFIIVSSVWYIFSFEAFNMALLLLAFELLFNKQKWYLFPVPIFLMGISMPFNLYVYGIFIASYALLRHLQTGTFNFKKLSSLFLKMAGLAIVGLLLSAPFLIINTLGLIESPRGNGGSSMVSILSSAPIFKIVDQAQLGDCIMRFFSSDLLGSEKSIYWGWWCYIEAPTFYCGLPCLLLMPQVFQFLNKRVKVVFIVFLSVWLLPVIFPNLRHAFWLFTGDYYRAYSFFVSLIFLYYSLIALEFILQNRKVNLVALIATMIILLVLINYPFFDRDKLNPPVFYFVMIMLIIYGLILFFIPKLKNPVFLKWIFLIVVVSELIYLTSISVDGRDAINSSELSEKKWFNDYTVDAVNYLKLNDKSFYRIDKSYISEPASSFGFDDAMVQEYYGTSCYSSFNQKYYINYLELMGIAHKTNEFSTRWTKGLFPYHILESENSVKYILTHAMNPNARVYFDSINEIGDVKILRNKFALPLGYTYSFFMKDSSFKLLSFAQKSFVSIRACVVNDKDIKSLGALKEYNGIIGDLHWEEDIKKLKNDTLTISQFNQNFIEGKINLNEDKMMYLSIPYDRGWHLKVDGTPTDKIILNDGMTGVVLKKGNHIIELKYELPFFNIGLLMSLFGILIYFGYWLYCRREPKIVS